MTNLNLNLALKTTKKISKLWNWKTKTLLVGIILTVSSLGFLKIGYKIGQRSSITNLPNSCFVDAMIYSSHCNFLLETSSEAWNSVYGFTFHYKDDPENSLGHAVCVFEYKNNLWIYDPNWGTSPVCGLSDKKTYKEKIRLYINQHYPIIIKEDFMVNDWTYIRKIKNRLNKSYEEVSIHLDEDKKE